MSIVIGKNELVDKFINYVMKDGKKSLAVSLLNQTFEEIKAKGQKKPDEVFAKALENVMPKIEVRPKRVGGSIYQVPQEVKSKRQLFLAARWILDSARSKKGISFSRALAVELIDAANETGNAVKKKLDVYKMAEANKAFARFANR
ncbi:MAG: 30S ribosomal protein S7 [Candidatus Gracilibacteria bacterium]|nr:30S ribosomal protein S7 [Candidatus Gracilibacteria bacterium]